MYSCYAINSTFFMSGTLGWRLKVATYRYMPKLQYCCTRASTPGDWWLYLVHSWTWSTSDQPSPPWLGAARMVNTYARPRLRRLIWETFNKQNWFQWFANVTGHDRNPSNEGQMTRVTRKQTLRSSSLSYQSLMSAELFKILKSRCNAKRRMGAAKRAHPSLGITTTKTLRSVFLWRASDVNQAQAYRSQQ